MAEETKQVKNRKLYNYLISGTACNPRFNYPGRGRRDAKTMLYQAYNREEAILLAHREYLDLTIEEVLRLSNYKNHTHYNEIQR